MLAGIAVERIAGKSEMGSLAYQAADARWSRATRLRVAREIAATL
jgi:hypothetical protein